MIRNRGMPWECTGGSDSNNEKTQKNMKIVMEENFIFSDRRFKHKFELSNLS